MTGRSVNGPYGSRADGPAPASADQDVVLVARLALPGGRFDVAAGQLVRLPDDPRHVAALLGAERAAPTGATGGTSIAGEARAADRGDVRGGQRRTGHRVSLAGRRLDRRGRAARVRAGLVGVGSAAVAPDVTVFEHLLAVCSRGEAGRRLGDAPLLADRAGDPAGVLSGGERRVLDWLVADALAPRAAVLDRPATGLDPAALRWAHGVLDGWLDAGVAILLRVGRDDETRWFHERADGTPRQV